VPLSIATRRPVVQALRHVPTSLNKQPALGAPTFCVEQELMRNRSAARSLRRRTPLISILLSAILTSVWFPALPAQAVSTSREIQAGQAEDKQITRQYGVVNDPLLNQWVNGVGERLWNQTARKDVPYNIKILDSADVNAFSTLGGYIYVNAATLEFVQSDDELAGVIGHETGHIERRHGVTYPAKAQALNLLLGIASLLSPIVGGFGQVAEAGVLAKASRAQEVQADQYGLLLMSRAGYDPDAMVSFMNHLGAAHEENDGDVDKYLADHPGFSERVARLAGYAALDPKKRTNDQILVQALHDQQSARYAVAARKFQEVLSKEPNNAIALLHLGQAQTALGLPNKAEQTLARAAEKSAPGIREQILSERKNIGDSLDRFTPGRPDILALRRMLDNAIANRSQVATELAQRESPAEYQIKAVDARLANISYDAPNLANVGARPNTRAGAVIKNVAEMSRSIDAALEKSRETIDGVGSLEKNKETGLIKDEIALLREMQAPLMLEVIPAQSLSLLRYYPSMLADLDRSTGDMRAAVEASRSALTSLELGLNDLNDFLRSLKQNRVDPDNDLQQSDYAALLPLMSKASSSLGKAAATGARARRLYDAARSRRLQTCITMLGLDYPQVRYETLRYALRQRFKNDGIAYDEMLRENLTPGEVAVASIVAAETNVAPATVAQEASVAHKSLIDIAESRNLNAFALDIFLDLVYLDYTDDPMKEANDTPKAPPTIAPPSITERS
jgi:predicted Zn-dependent protease